MILRAPMPVRATKRGAARTPLGGRLRRPDLRRVVRRPRDRARAARHAARACSCSTATRSASARPPRARRRRSGCATSGWTASIRQTFGSLVVHTPRARRALAAAVGRSRRSTTGSCATCCGRSAAPGRSSRPPRSHGRDRRRWCTPTAATCSAPLIVDALGWKRMLGRGARAAAGRAALARAGGPPRRARARDLELWIDKRVIRAGYGWAFPARRRGPHRHRLVRPARPRQGADGRARRRRSASRPTATRATGSRTGSAPAVEDGVFFVGDSAGHCLPLTAEGIRTAFYFASPAGASCAPCSRAARPRERALARYGAFSARTLEVRVRCSACSTAIPRLRPRPLGRLTRVFRRAARCRTGRSGTT